MAGQNADMTMGVYRLIYAGFSKGRRIASVSVGAEAWFWRIHCIADDFGNYESEARLCLSTAAPYRTEWTETDVDAFHAELIKVGLIEPYENNGDRYMHIVGWDKRQPPRRNGRRIQRCPLPGNPGASGGIRVHQGASGCILGNPGAESAPDTDTDTDTRSDTDTDAHTEADTDADVGAEAEIQTTAAGALRKTGTGSDRGRAGSGRWAGQPDDRLWSQLVLMDLAAALRISPERFASQRRSLGAVVSRACGYPDRDFMASNIIQIAKEKCAAPGLEKPIAAWQKEVDRILPAKDGRNGIRG